LSSVLIIGGGITGLQAAQNLSQVGIGVVLVEQSDQLGGNLKALGSTFPEGRGASELIAARANALKDSSCLPAGYCAYRGRDFLAYG
jgi:heterodisulfide reductase subunit A